MPKSKPQTKPVSSNQARAELYGFLAERGWRLVKDGKDVVLITGDNALETTGLFVPDWRGDI